MDDKNKIICDDFIKEKLKSFLDDLLTEDEYRTFNDHIKTCDKCNTYVRSISSLSNQIWKLGKVETPSDLSSTIMHKVDHPGKESQLSESTMLKKCITAGLILILLAAAAFSGIKHFKNQQKVNETDSVVVVKTEDVEMGRNSELPGDDEAQFLLKPPEAVTLELDVFEKDDTIVEALPKEDIVDEETSAVNESPDQERGAIDLKDVLLHWHFQYSKIDDAKLKGLLRRIKQKKDFVQAKVGGVENKIFLLEEEKRENQLKLGQRYSEGVKAVKLAEERQKEFEIQQKGEERKQLEAVLEDLEKERRQLELNQQQKLKSEIHKLAVHKTKVLNVFSFFRIIPDYKDDNLFVFRVNGEQLENVREQILFASQGTCSLRNFTDGEAIHSEGKYLVSMYLQKRGISALHWHMSLVGPSRMSDLLQMIETKGATIDYKSERLIVFSIQRDEIESLRQQIGATRANFSEFGLKKFNESQLSGVSSNTAKISVFFTKE